MSDYNGIQDISSMQFGVFSQSNQQKPQKNKSQGSSQLPLKIVIPAAVIVIVAVLALLFLPEAIAKAQAKKACEDFVSGLAGEDVQWDKYYSDEIAEYLADESTPDSESVDLDIQKIKKINVKRNRALLKKKVKNFYQGEFELDAPADVNVKRGYVISCELRAESEVIDVSVLVLKIDGKYGVYDTGDSEYYDDNF